MSSVVTERFIKCHDKLREDKVVRSSRQFAIALDYLPQSLSEILKLRRDVTIELLRKSVEVYKINPVFLYTGDGPMFMSEGVGNNMRMLTIVTNSSGDEKILHVPVPAQAGYASEINNPTFIEELPAYTLPDYKYKVGTHRSFDVAGDSMEPTLFEGDKVICSYLEPNLWLSSIKDNYVYVIVTRGDVLVKRIYNKINDGKRLMLVSDNDYYEPYPVNIVDIKEMWYVRAKLSPFLPSPSNISTMVHDEVRELRSTITQQSRVIRNLNESMERFMKSNGMVEKF